jgi:hypothetical protein
VSKSKKKRPYTCLVCGKGMRRRDPACKRCGHRNPGFVPKGASGPAFIAKSAGRNVTPIGVAKSARPVCHCGHRGRRTDRCCTRCGLPYGISEIGAEGRALKAAGIIPGGYWAGKAAGESDPQAREIMRARAFRDSARPPDAETLAREWGFASLQAAAMYCTDGAARSYFVKALNNGGAA